MEAPRAECAAGAPATAFASVAKDADGSDDEGASATASPRKGPASLDPGGTRDSPQFEGFVELCVRGFLAARGAAEPIIAAVSLMRDSGLPCFGYGAPLESLRARFMLGATDAQAGAAFRERVDNAYDNFSTGFYDFVQYAQNAIPK